METEQLPGSGTSEDSPTRDSVHVQSDASLEQDESDAEGVPKGPVYSLNSKRLTALHLQRIADSLGLPTKGSAAVTRQLIEGKLMEMGKEPPNVQVVVQGTDENSVLFLINEDGIIRTIKPARDRVVHVSSQPVDAARDEGPVETRSALRESEGEPAEVEQRLETQSLELQRVRELLRQAEAEVEEGRTPTQQHDEELHGLRAVVAKEKQKVKRIWWEKCEQLSHEEAIYRKDMEIARLKARLLAVTSPPSPPTSPGSSIRVVEDEPRRPSSSHRRGKASPVDSFSAESLDEQWDDWLPTLERAAEWNGWTDSERLLQLAGHLRGKTRVFPTVCR